MRARQGLKPEAYFAAFGLVKAHAFVRKPQRLLLSQAVKPRPLLQIFFDLIFGAVVCLDFVDELE
jgi:hypothetical protein